MYLPRQIVYILLMWRINTGFVNVDETVEPRDNCITESCLSPLPQQVIKEYVATELGIEWIF